MNTNVEIKPLAHLPVIRETYCSQKMTDDIIDYLEKEDPHGRFTGAYLGQSPNRLEANSLNLSKAIGQIHRHDAGCLEKPSTIIGEIDLAFELARRINKARGFKDLEVVGKPLAPHIDGPYPDVINLPKIQIDKMSAKAGLTQEMVDKAIAAAYEQNPEIFYIIAEAWRRDYNFSTFGEFKPALEKIKKNHPDIQVEHSQISSFMNEASIRVGSFCEIPTFLRLREIRDESDTDS